MDWINSNPKEPGKTDAECRSRREAVVQVMLEVREKGFFGPPRQRGHMRLLPGGEVDEGFGQPEQEGAEGKQVNSLRAVKLP